MNLTDFICVTLLSGFAFIFFSFKLIAVLQQCGYRLDEFFTALFCGKKIEIKRLSTYSLVFAVVLALICPFNDWILNGYFLPSVVTVIFSGAYYFTTKQIKKAVFTSRLARVWGVATVAFGLGLAGLTYLASIFITRVRFLIFLIGLTPILSPVFIALGCLVNLPYDFLKYKISLSICKSRLKRNPKLKVIGVTGSMGKTSVKNYLFKMLATTYKTLATPMSYNTPLGVCKTVNGGVEGYDFFIVEMGARRKNDIKKLCKLVNPSIGVITGIAEQHTQTLKGLQGVINAKNQLIEGLLPNGFAVFSTQTQGSLTMCERAKVKKYGAGLNDGDFVYAKNIIQKKDGLHFDIVVGGNPYQTFMPALGVHNVINACIATATAVNLGVSVSKILSVIPNLTPPPHRAEIITTPQGVTVIDDAYNANLLGISATAQAVKAFDGRKVAITSGIVELGERAYAVNFEVGKILAENFDEIFAVGVNANAVFDGAKTGGVTAKVESSTKSASERLKGQLTSGDVVAFFNDLPDKYEV